MKEYKQAKQEKRKYMAARNMRGDEMEHDVREQARAIFRTPAFAGTALAAGTPPKNLVPLRPKPEKGIKEIEIACSVWQQEFIGRLFEEAAASGECPFEKIECDSDSCQECLSEHIKYEVTP